MKMKQETRQARKREQEQPEVEAQDLRNEELAEDTEDVLDAIECCLAEVEADDLDVKKAAKAEWDEIMRKYHEGETDQNEALYSMQQWGYANEGLFNMHWCCGVPSPDFGDLE